MVFQSRLAPSRLAVLSMMGRKAFIRSGVMVFEVVRGGMGIVGQQDRGGIGKTHLFDSIEKNRFCCRYRRGHGAGEFGCQGVRSSYRARYPGGSFQFGGIAGKANRTSGLPLGSAKASKPRNIPLAQRVFQARDHFQKFGRRQQPVSCFRLSQENRAVVANNQEAISSFFIHAIEPGRRWLAAIRFPTAGKLAKFCMFNS